MINSKEISYLISAILSVTIKLAVPLSVGCSI